MKRLRDESSSDFVKTLLDSAAADVPSPQSEKRTLRAAENELTVPRTWPRAWAIGGTIVGIAGLLLLLGHAYQSGTTASAAPAASAAATDVAPAQPPDVVPSSPPIDTMTAAQPTASVAADVSAVAQPTPATATPPVAASGSATEPPLGLRDELALIDEARSDLDGGNAGEALKVLARYDARYPAGTLREEATAVRVEALFLSGKRAEARAAGEAFLRDHPDSTHAQHVRSLLDTHAP
ncbi:hypothetical protein BH09MYX1_BH09MYX1_32670 [soil metagenome]